MNIFEKLDIIENQKIALSTIIDAFGTDVPTYSSYANAISSNTLYEEQYEEIPTANILTGFYCRRSGEVAQSTSYKICEVNVMPGEKYQISAFMKAQIAIIAGNVRSSSDQTYSLNVTSVYFDNYEGQVQKPAAWVFLPDVVIPESTTKLYIPTGINDAVTIIQLKKKIVPITKRLAEQIVQGQKNTLSAQTDTWRKFETSFDKAQVMFMTDDGRSDNGYITQFLHDAYDYPMGQAVPLNSLAGELIQDYYEDGSAERIVSEHLDGQYVTTSAKPVASQYYNTLKLSVKPNETYDISSYMKGSLAIMIGKLTDDGSLTNRKQLAYAAGSQETLLYTCTVKVSGDVDTIYVPCVRSMEYEVNFIKTDYPCSHAILSDLLLDASLSTETWGHDCKKGRFTDPDPLPEDPDHRKLPSPEEFERRLKEDYDVLTNLGLSVTGFVSPWYDDLSEYAYLIAKYFKYARRTCISADIHQYNFQPYNFKHDSIEQIKAKIDDAIENKRLLIFFCHNLVGYDACDYIEDPITHEKTYIDYPEGFKMYHFRQIVDYIKQKEKEGLLSFSNMNKIYKTFY